MSGHLRSDTSWVQASEVFFHRGREQSRVRNFAKMLGDKPDWSVRRHPILTIETRQVNRPGIGSQGALESQIEIDIEVAHGQFA